MKKIRGTAIIQYIPEVIKVMIMVSVKDVELQWNDKLIEECTMTIGDNGECLVVYQQNPITGSGTFLFGFHLLPELNHRFSYSKPWRHIDQQ